MDRSRLQHASRLARANRLVEAERVCRQWLMGQPNDPAALRLLGELARSTGRAHESVQIFQRLRQARPNDRQLVGELGASLTAAGQAAQALPLLKKAVASMPNAPVWRVWLGRCLLRLFKLGPAIETLEEARRLDPEGVEALLPLAAALDMAARADLAEPVVREYLAKHPDSLPARVNLAQILQHRNRLDEAIVECRAVLEHYPSHDGALGILAGCLHAKRRTDEAVRAVEPLLAEDPTPGRVVALVPVYLATRRYEESRELCERALDADHLAPPVRSSLFAALATAHQGLGDHDRAFEAFARSNACLAGEFSRERHTARYNHIREAFTPELVASRSSVNAGRCVFIVGMPRSGTTLIEQVLDAHPRVFGAGELPDIPSIAQSLADELGGEAPACLADLTPAQLRRAGERYLSAIDALPHAGATRIVDKQPHNFEYLGFIARALPGARIIHATRNPIDTCLSCFTTQLSAWHEYAHDLADLGFAYAQYQRLMAYWRGDCAIGMLEVRYEDTVADLEAQARRVIGHLGLEWDESCLRFHESERAVTTPSIDQVRRPIYTSSVERWRCYEKHLGPLIDSLVEHGVLEAESVSG